VLAKSLKEYALAAEIIGAIAVVISLIYVGVSVNQNTNALMVANHQALVAMDQTTTDWFKDPAFVATWQKAEEDVGQLSSVEVAQAFSYLAGKLNAWEFAFLTHEDGMMADNIWVGWDAHYRTVLKQEACRKFWKLDRESFSPAFRHYLDSIIAVME
jgi:hypothetical protein